MRSSSLQYFCNIWTLFPEYSRPALDKYVRRYWMENSIPNATLHDDEWLVSKYWKNTRNANTWLYNNKIQQINDSIFHMVSSYLLYFPSIPAHSYCICILVSLCIICFLIAAVSKVIKSNTLCIIVSISFVMLCPFMWHSKINFMLPFVWAGYGAKHLHSSRLNKHAFFLHHDFNCHKPILE